jgi:hypothetical protein
MRKPTIPDDFSSKAMDLVGQVGDSIRHAMPSKAGSLVKAGAALGATRTGLRAAGLVARRHPVALAAAAAAAGVAWYAVRRHQRKAEEAALTGRSRRIEARRGGESMRYGDDTVSGEDQATSARHGATADASANGQEAGGADTAR